MQEIIKSLDQRKHEDGATAPAQASGFSIAAADWARHSVLTYSGETLTKAMAISQAMVAFEDSFKETTRE